MPVTTLPLLGKMGQNGFKPVGRYSYDPYGKVTVLHGVQGYDPEVDGVNIFEWMPKSANPDGSPCVSRYDNEILYCGYRFDWETGLYNVRHRIYHPTLGRWTRRDPAGYVDGLNLVEAVRSNPIIATDPYGEKLTIWAITSKTFVTEIEKALLNLCSKLKFKKVAIGMADVKIEDPPFDNDERAGCKCLCVIIKSNYRWYIQQEEGSGRIPNYAVADSIDGYMPPPPPKDFVGPPAPNKGSGGRVVIDDTYKVKFRKDKNSKWQDEPLETILAHELCGHAVLMLQGLQPHPMYDDKEAPHILKDSEKYAVGVQNEFRRKMKLPERTVEEETKVEKKKNK